MTTMTLFSSSLLFLLLAAASLLQQHAVTSAASSSSLPNNKPSFLVIPRGGGASGDDDAPNNNTPNTNPTTIMTFEQQLKHYESSMTAFLNHYQTATKHMVHVLERTTELNHKTESALEQLKVGLFRVHIQLSMLPPVLSQTYQTLHTEMEALQSAAMSMLAQLTIYTDIVTKCLTMVHTLIEVVQQKATELPQLQKDERRLRRPQHNNKKHVNLQKRVQEEVMALQQTTMGINNEILVLDKQAREEVWPLFMEQIKQVQEAARTVDRLFQSIVVRNQPNHQGNSDNNNNHNSAAVAGNWTPPGASSSPVTNYNYGLEEANVQEVEVEMTTYQFNIN